MTWGALPLAACLIEHAVCVEGLPRKPGPQPEPFSARFIDPPRSNFEKNARRQEVKTLGRRQLLKATKAGRRHAREK